MICSDCAIEGVPKLYIGDQINWQTASDPVGYFLAAVDQTRQEAVNINFANISTTVSTADKVRAEMLVPYKEVFVDGFPIDLEAIDSAARGVTKNHRRKVIGFLGRTARDKGIDKEIEIAKELSTYAGIDVVHISSTPNSAAKTLIELGVEVMQNLTKDQYLGNLALLSCVINASPRESLFVSGIEATRMGIPVIAPNVAQSGILEWNNPEWIYDQNNASDAAELAVRLCSINSDDIPDVSQFSATHYVKRVKERIVESSGRP